MRLRSPYLHLPSLPSWTAPPPPKASRSPGRAAPRAFPTFSRPPHLSLSFPSRSQLDESRRAELTRANLSPEDIVPRICSTIRVESVFIRAAQAVAQRFTEEGIAIDSQVTKHQTSMAAAFVWLVLQLRADSPRVVRLLDPAAPDPDAREAWADETRPADIDWDRSTTKRQVYRAGVVTRIEEVAEASGMAEVRLGPGWRGRALRPQTRPPVV